MSPPGKVLKTVSKPVHELAGKSVAQKGQERRLLFARKMQRDNVLVEVGIGIAAAIIELHHIFKRRQAAVVHVRTAPSYFAQSGRLECASVVGLAGDGGAALVFKLTIKTTIVELTIAPGHSGVVEGFVG